MELTIYQVDAFAEKIFLGNPAAVCPLEKWLPDDLLQSIAQENNLAETAFYVPETTGLRIRWFTPALEVDLCGHATLAAAYVLLYQEGFPGEQVVFNSRSGPLTVTKRNERLVLDFPLDIYHETTMPIELKDAIHLAPLKTFRGKTDYMLVFENESQVRSLKPDMGLLVKVPARGIIVTAPGEKSDFVSRFFAPQSGVNEDPVTGSAHTTLTPYWASVLGKTELTAIQCSARGGRLNCALHGERVKIGGQAQLYMKGTLYIR